MGFWISVIVGVLSVIGLLSASHFYYKSEEYDENYIKK